MGKKKRNDKNIGIEEKPTFYSGSWFFVIFVRIP